MLSSVDSSPLLQHYVSQQIFEKYKNVKFHKKNASSGIRVQCGPTEGRAEIDRQTDITKLIDAFRNIFKRAYLQTIQITIIVSFDSSISVHEHERLLKEIQSFI